jgi:hypothetical protein
MKDMKNVENKRKKMTAETKIKLIEPVKGIGQDGETVTVDAETARVLVHTKLAVYQ